MKFNSADMQPGQIKDSISEPVDKLTLDSGSCIVSFPLIPGIISTVAEFLNDKDLQQLRLVGRSFAASASSRCKRLDLQLPFDPPLGRQIFVKQAATVQAVVKVDGQLDPACHGLQQLAQQLPMLSSLFLSIPSETVPVVERPNPFVHNKVLTVPTNISSSFAYLSRLDIICTARDPWQHEFVHHDVCLALPEGVTLPALKCMCFAMRFSPSDYEERAEVSPGPVSLASISAFAPNLHQFHYGGTLKVSAGSLLPRCTHLGVGRLEVATVPSQEQGEVYVPAAASAPAAGDVLAAAFPVLEVVTAVSGLHPPDYDNGEEGYPMGMVFKQLKSLRAIRNIHPYRHLPAGVWNGDPDGLQQLTALSRLTLKPNTNPRAVAAAQRGLGQLTQLQHLRLSGITPSFLDGQPHLLQLRGLQTLAVPAGLLCWQCHMQEGSLIILQGGVLHLRHLVVALRQLTCLQKVVFIAQEGQPLCPGQLEGQRHFPDGPGLAMNMLEESLHYFKAAVAVAQGGSGSTLQVELLQLPASDWCLTTASQLASWSQDWQQLMQLASAAAANRAGGSSAPRFDAAAISAALALPGSRSSSSDAAARDSTKYIDVNKAYGNINADYGSDSSDGNDSNNRVEDQAGHSTSDNMPSMRPLLSAIPEAAIAADSSPPRVGIRYGTSSRPAGYSQLGAQDPIVSPGRITLASKVKSARFSAAAHAAATGRSSPGSE